MKQLLFTLILLIAGNSYSQTRKIFHKSHSGKSGTMFKDSKNNFGPGMAPVRYRTPESPIKLNKIVTDKHEYPLVDIDTIKKTMKFIDMNDSIIGCNRNYEQYLSHGDIVYDQKQSEFFVYHTIQNVKQTRVFIKITDSINVWEKREHTIRRRSAFIRDGNNHRILMYYPNLNYLITSSLLKQPSLEPEKKTPAKKKITPRTDEKTMPVKPASKESAPVTFNQEQEQEESILLVSPTKGNTGSLLRWMLLFLLLFALFIFVGVKQIVKEEVKKIKRYNA